MKEGVTVFAVPDVDDLGAVVKAGVAPTVAGDVAAFTLGLQLPAYGIYEVRVDRCTAVISDTTCTPGTWIPLPFPSGTVQETGTNTEVTLGYEALRQVLGADGNGVRIRVIEVSFKDYGEFVPVGELSVFYDPPPVPLPVG
jgi:hypothetical protein